MKQMVPRMATNLRDTTKTFGNGPFRLIAVHGWMADHRVLEPIVEWFDPSMATVALLDCRGYGSRRDEAGPFTIETIARDILRLADELGWSEFNALGHSMAAMSVQRLMVDVPRRIERAFLLAPVPACGAIISDERKSVLITALRNRDARIQLIDANTGRSKGPEWLSELCDLSISGTSADVMDAYMRSWTGTDFAHEIIGNRTPSTIIVGSLDPGATEARMQETLSIWLPNSEIAVMQGVGHYASYEKPRELADLISHRMNFERAGRP